MDWPDVLPPFFWQAQALVVAIVLAVYWGGGILAGRGVPVSYTRKIVHFATFATPLFADYVFFPGRRGLAAVGLSLLTVVLFVGMSRPVRHRIPFFERMFQSIDRPEDRPHTWAWLASQLAVGGTVLVMVGLALEEAGRGVLVLLPLFANGLGDGLAEVVGVRWGRTKYAVPSLIPGRKYTRSIEGSLAMLLVTALVVMAFYPALDRQAFWILLALFPVVATLTEAVSPHAWDAPLLFATTGGLVWWIVA